MSKAGFDAGNHQVGGTEEVLKNSHQYIDWVSNRYTYGDDLISSFSPRVDFHARLPPMPKIDIDNFNGNIFLLVAMVADKVGYMMNTLSLEQRQVMRDISNQELQTMLKAINKNLNFKNLQSKKMLEGAEFQLSAGKKIMELTKVQYRLKLATAATKAVESLFAAFGFGSSLASDILGASVGVLDNVIPVIRDLASAQKEMLDAVTNLLGAHADATMQEANAVVQKLGHMYQLVQELAQIFRQIAERIAQLVDQLTSNAYTGATLPV